MVKALHPHVSALNYGPTLPSSLKHWRMKIRENFSMILLMPVNIICRLNLHSFWMLARKPQVLLRKLQQVCFICWTWVMVFIFTNWCTCCCFNIICIILIIRFNIDIQVFVIGRCIYGHLGSKLMFVNRYISLLHKIHHVLRVL